MLSQVREIKNDEIDSVLEWAKNERWDIGKYDGMTYYQLSSRDFLVLTINHGLAGVILAAKYNLTFVFIGLFIIKEPFRSQGYGRQLWNAAIERLGHYSSINLYAVPQQVPFYRHLGLTESHLNKRYSLCREQRDHLFVSDCFELLSNFSLLAKYDQQISGISRGEFLGLILSQPEVLSIVALEKNLPRLSSVERQTNQNPIVLCSEDVGSSVLSIDTEQNQEIIGYGIVRRCLHSYRLGPVYSNTFEGAQVITQTLLNQIPIGEKVILDIPEKNPSIYQYLSFFGFSPQSDMDTYLMFKGESQELAGKNCFGLASLEIG